MDDKSCYYKNCKNEITSSEHIPPKCLFPKGYRKELITVPSCDEHNTQKSNKDEYFRNILTLHVENNILGGEIAENKTFRSISRNRLSENSILKDFIPSIGVKIDPIKFNIIISGISYGHSTHIF